MIRFACFEFRYVIVHEKVCVGMVHFIKLKKTILLKHAMEQ